LLNKSAENKDGITALTAVFLVLPAKTMNLSNDN
jgi:hypothetical protein